MSNLSLTAPAISCGGCADSIKRILGKLTGVSSVDVDVETKRVDVSFNEAATTADAIRQRLAAAGFPAE